MIFVLGGRGFLGSAFVEQAKKRGEACVAITKENYEAYKGRRCRVFINANGNSKKYLTGQNPLLDFELSVTSTLRSLVDFRFRHYLFISSTTVYDVPSDRVRTREAVSFKPPLKSPYGFHKYLAELLVMQYAKSWLILRLGGLIGPGLKKGPIYDLLEGESLWVSRNSKFQFLGTEAAASIGLELLRRKKFREIYNLAGRGALRLKEAAKAGGLHCAEHPNAAAENWNVSLKKIGRVLKIPSTGEALKRFFETAIPSNHP